MRLVGTKTEDETLLGIGRLLLQNHPKIQKVTSPTPQLVELVMDVRSGEVQRAIVRPLRTGLLQCYWATPPLLVS